MSICIRWGQIKGADVASFKIYRSIVGFIATDAQGSAIDGTDLVLNMNGTGEQTFVFNDTDSAVTTINQTIEGGHAFDSFQDDTKFLLRSDIKDENGSVEIVGGTAMNALGITPRVITEQSEEDLIHTEPVAEEENATYEYKDPDGDTEDWYRMTTVDSNGNESRPTEYKQATSDSGALCVVEGMVTDLQGARVPDAVIQAQIMDFDQTVIDPTYVSTDVIETLSQSDGRWALPILQNTLVRLVVDAVNYDEYVRIPEKTWVEWTDLEITQEHRWRVP